MTPGINVAKKAKIPHKIHEYEHDPSSESYGTEAAEKMGVLEERVFKTLMGVTRRARLLKINNLEFGTQFSHNRKSITYTTRLICIFIRNQETTG